MIVIEPGGVKTPIWSKGDDTVDASDGAMRRRRLEQRYGS